MRVASFDCGTNSLRLLIADVENGHLTDVTRLMRVVRLGEGVDATGEIAPEAMARALATTHEYADLCTAAGAQRMRFVATSASRDARNAADFVNGVHRILGIDPEVISGDEEAELSFLGATTGVTHHGRSCVVDLGGGSTEIVLGSPGSSQIQAAFSMNVGCVRMTERHLRSDPPTEAEVAAATADIDAALEEAAAVVPFDEVDSLIGVAGTVTTLTAAALRLPEYDAQVIHGAVLGVSQTLQMCDEMLWMSREQRSRYGFMHPGRVDVIGSGALVWSRVVSRIADASGVTTVTTSEHDILDGIALALARD